MKYCRSCLQPDTRPNIEFRKDGLCPACHYYKNSLNEDWDERFEILRELIKKNPKKKNQYFDCIIGVSGGKDSTRQALWVRDKLGLNPLCVCFSYPPEQVTELGVDNLSNLIELGFDTLIVASEPQTWRKTLKEGFMKFQNMQKAGEYAIVSCVPKVAIKYKIPLIFWGENPGWQLGDMKTVGKNGYDGNNLRYMNTVAGGDLKWLLDAGLTKENLITYKHPSSEEFDAADIQIIYLGWFWDDWSIINNGMYSVSNGLGVRSATVEETGDLTRVFSLDEDWVTLNQMIKYYKYGFGRVSDHVNESVRRGLMTREEGITLIEKFDGSCSEKYIKNFCDYIDITKEEFWEQVHSCVNKELFEISPDGKIYRNFEVGYGL